MKVVFNPAIEDILASEKKRILFVHVGQCGGKAAMKALSRVVGDDHIMFEMHVQGSDAKIRQVVENHNEDFTFLIAKRDPIDRFVASFNWDKHNLFLRDQIRVERNKKFYPAFPTCEQLALGLTSRTAAISTEAKDFGHFAHMGMGQSFYTPADVLAKIPPAKLHTLDVESMEADLRSFLTMLGVEVPADLGLGAVEDLDYLAGYPDSAKLFPTKLNRQAKKNLTTFLADDFEVYKQLEKANLKNA